MLARLVGKDGEVFNEIVVWVDDKGAPPGIIRDVGHDFIHSGTIVPRGIAVYRYLPPPKKVSRSYPPYNPSGAVMETPPVIGPTARAQALSLVKIEAEKYGVTTQDVLGPSRSPKIVSARHHAAASIYASGWPQCRIARFLHRDHTSIQYALRKMGVYQRKAGG